MLTDFLDAAILNDFVRITLRGALPTGYAAKLDAAGIEVVENNENCGVWLKGEAATVWASFLGAARPHGGDETWLILDVPCIVAAEDDLGNWTVIFDHPIAGGGGFERVTRQFIGGKEVA